MSDIITIHKLSKPLPFPETRNLETLNKREESFLYGRSTHKYKFHLVLRPASYHLENNYNHFNRREIFKFM